MSKIPDVPSTENVPDGPLAWLKNWLDQVRLWVQTRDPRATRVGDPLDKFTDRRELVDLGILRRSSDGTFRPGDGFGGGSTIVVPGGGGGGGGPDFSDLTPPPAPTGLTAVGGIVTLQLAWDAPIYTQGRGNGQTNIYGAVWEEGTSKPTLGDPRTKRIDSAMEATTLHSYPTQPATRWVVWIKFQTRNGVEGPPSASADVITGQDVSSLLEILTGQIRDSELFSALGDRIDLIDAPDTVAGSVAARIKAEADARAAALIAEAEDRTDAIAAEAAARALAIGAEAAARAGDILQEQEERATAISNLQAALSADIDGALAAVDSTATTLRSEFAAADAATLATANSFTYSRATIDAADAATLSTLRTEYQDADDTTLSAAQSYVQAYGYSFAGANTAIADAVSTVSARLNDGGDVYASILSTQTKVDAKSANFTQPTAPTNPSNGVALRLNDLWIDTASGNKLKRWNGTAWVDADDVRIGTSAESITTLTSQVGNKNKVFRQRAVPTATATGDLWIDTGSVNLLLFSEELDNISAWIRAAGATYTVTPNSTLAPDGTSTADTVRLTAAGSSGVFQVATVTPGETYTFSWSAQRSLDADVRYRIYNQTAGVDIVAPTSYYSQIAAGSWTRMQVTFTAPAGCTQVRVYPVHGISSGGAGAIAWGGQMELGSGAGRYIKTTIAAVSTLNNNQTYVWSGTQWLAADDARIEATRALLLNEYTTTAGMTAAISEAKTTLRAEFDAADDAISSTLTTNYYTKAQTDSAVASSTSTLAAQMRGSYTGTDLGSITSGLLYQERQARISQDNALSQQITLLSAGAGKQFDYATIWYFDAGLESWTRPGTSTDLTNNAGWLKHVSNSGSVSNPYIESPDALGIDAAKYTQVRLRIRKYGTPAWEGALYFQTVADPSFSEARKATLAAPSYDTNGIAVITFDAPASWAGTIKRIRFDLLSAVTTTDYLEIDWIAIGRPSPGASSAQLVELEEAIAGVDSAQTTARQTLASQVRGGYTGSDIALAGGLFESERIARTEADAAEVTARQALSTKLTGTASPGSLTLETLSSGLLYDERQARSTADTSQVSRIENLESTVNNPATGVSATAGGLSSITAIVTNGSTGVVATSTRVDALTARVTSPSATPADPAFNPVYASLLAESSARATLDGDVRALYTLRAEVSAGGRTVVGGFGLAGTASAGAGPRIDFGVRADSFFVEAPSGGGNPTTRLTPFTIRTTSFSENGVLMPAGVYMDAAFMTNLTAMYARISSLVADSISAASISVSKLTAGTLAVGSHIQSTDYTSGPGGAGYRLTSSSIELPATAIRGLLTADQIDSRGLSIKDALGNVILAAGSSLNWSNVGGAGRPIDNASRVVDLGAGSATFGQRDRNDAPNEYGAPGTYLQFKTSAAIGLTGASTYATLETTVPYGTPPDTTGGPVIQYAYSAEKTWRRTGPRSGLAGSWSAWVQDLDRNAYTGDLDATRGAPAGTLVGGVAASTVASAATNFNASNDRNAAAVAAPTVAVDGTAVDHSLRDDGSADVSFEWSWAGAEGDIDGFQVFVYQSTSATAYTFGTFVADEVVYEIPAAKRAFILFGVPANTYYTFGVRAYRKVDKDIAASGVILSSLVKATAAGENPYRPSSSVAFAGNVTGTVAGTAASTLVATATTAATNAATANSLLADIAADTKLTPVEKQSVRAEWDAVYAERADIRAKADAMGGVATEKAAYDAAFQALGTYLNGGTAYTIGATRPVWITDATQLAVTTTIVGDTFRANWAALYAARQALLNKIAEIAATKATWANVSGAGRPADNATVGANADNFAGTVGLGNLIGNGSFEILASSGSGPAGWGAYSSTTPVLPAFRVTGRSGAGFAFAIKATGTGTGGGFGALAMAATADTTLNVSAHNRHGWQPNRTYTVAFWAKKVGASNLGSMFLNWNTFPATTQSVSSPTLTTAWQRYVFRITWGASVEGGGSLYLSVTQAANLVANDELHLDEVVVVEGDVIPSYAEGIAGDYNATYGAAFGTNISGQITPGNASTYIASAAIGFAQVGTLKTQNLEIGAVTALSSGGITSTAIYSGSAVVLVTNDSPLHVFTKTNGDVLLVANPVLSILTSGTSNVIFRVYIRITDASDNSLAEIRQSVTRLSSTYQNAGGSMAAIMRRAIYSAGSYTLRLKTIIEAFDILGNPVACLTTVNLESTWSCIETKV